MISFLEYCKETNIKGSHQEWFWEYLTMKSDFIESKEKQKMYYELWECLYDLFMNSNWIKY